MRDPIKNEAAALINLITRKYNGPADLQLDREIFMQGIVLLKALPCIWCKYPRISGELLQLLSLPENDGQRWFCERTAQSLSSCAECLETYYAVRPELDKAFAKFYEAETLRMFWKKISDFDVLRIHAPLTNFLDGKIDGKNALLLFALYELLLNPNHLQNEILHKDFAQVLTLLVATNKMIRVYRFLPGVLFCLFDDNAAVRRWATSVLQSPNTERVEGFPPGSLDLEKLVKEVDLFSDHTFDSLVLLSKWLPKNVSMVVLDSLLRQFAISMEVRSRYKAALEAVNSCLETSSNISEESWRVLVEAIVGSPSFKEIPSDEFSDLWVTALSRWSVQYSNVHIILKLIEHMLPFVNYVLPTSNLENIVKILCTLMTPFIIPLLLPAHEQQLYRVISAFVHQTKAADNGSLAVKMAVLCCDLDYHLLLASKDNEFRGFARLLCELMDVSTHGQKVIAEILRRINRVNVDFADFIKRRQFIASKICDLLPSDAFTKESAPILLFFLSNHVEGTIEQVKKLLKSYPENYIHGLLQLCSITKEMTQGSLKKYSLQVIKLFLGTLPEEFFIGPKGTLIDMFPEQKALFVNVISIGLQMACLCIKGLANDELDRCACQDLEKTLEFTSRVYEIIPAKNHKSSFRANILSSTEFLHLYEVFLKFSLAQASTDGSRSSRIIGFLLDLARIREIKLPPAIQKLFSMMLITIKWGPSDKIIINTAIDEFEKATSTILPRPPSEQVKKELSTKRPHLIVNLDLENRVLQEIQSAQEIRRERSLPIVLRGSMIPIIPKPATRFEQLKADVTRDNPTNPKRRGIGISGPLKKPQKMEQVRSSSSESELEEDYGRLGFSKTNPVPPEIPIGNRSIKLIDIAEEPIVKRDASKGASLIHVTETNLIRQFHRKILHFNLKDLETMPDNMPITNVPNSFETAEHYISVFEPLLFMECRAQLTQSREESVNSGIQTMRISSVAHVDNFHEVTLQKNSDGNDERIGVSDQDYLVVFFNQTKESLTAIIVQCAMRGGVFEVIIRFSIPNEKSALQIELREGLDLNFQKIGNVITNLREYTAMHMVSNLQLAPALFSPHFLPTQSISISTELGGISNALKINTSQAKAISAVIQGVNPITLIQGPPGTGKTKTIEALLGVLLGQTGATARPKVMICAPSNAAIDEIVKRIRHGLVSRTGEPFSVKVLRVGSIDMISDQVKDLTLDSQADNLLDTSAASSTKLLKVQRKACEDLRRSLHDAERARREDHVKKLKTLLWEARENVRKNNKFIEDTRATLKQKILNEAHVICCTLSSSGHDMLARIDFEYLIIDEACQAVELSCLVPLQRNCRQCVLVGVAGVFSYEQSLFVRLQKQCPESVLLLDTQYRMHPDISRFPNSYFYQNRLIDGPKMESLNRRPWHDIDYLGPFRFFDITGQEGSWRRGPGIESHSKMNELEAQAAANLVAMICASFPQIEVRSFAFVELFRWLYDPKIWYSVARLRKLNNLYVKKSAPAQLVEPIPVKTPTAIQTTAQRRIVHQQALQSKDASTNKSPGTGRTMVDDILDRSNK